MGFEWDWYETSMVQYLTRLAHAQAYPTVPMVAHRNPTWDWTGLAIWDEIHIPFPPKKLWIPSAIVLITNYCQMQIIFFFWNRLAQKGMGI